jgi:phosphosulfolactate synthase (CoM biosynthesis protein A)
MAFISTAGPPANMYANITGNSVGSVAVNNSVTGTLSVQSGNQQAVRLDKYGVTDSMLRSIDLEKDVFKIPIDTLINLWVTRFGNEWVDLETIDNDDFFVNAYKRLKQLGHLEQHYLTDRAKYVCRKPE